MKLFKLVYKNCNGSTKVVTLDKVGNLIKALCNCILVRAEDYLSFPKYIKASKHLFKILEATELSIATEILRDEYMSKLEKRGQKNTMTCKHIMKWKMPDSMKIEEDKYYCSIKEDR